MISLKNFIKESVAREFDSKEIVQTTSASSSSELQVSILIQQTCHARQTNFNIITTNNLNVGLNALTNRLHHLHGKIPLIWLKKLLH